MCSKMSDERMIRYLLEAKEDKNIVVKNMKKGYVWFSQCSDTKTNKELNCYAVRYFLNCTQKCKNHYHSH